MNLPASLFGNELLWLANLLFAALLVRALRLAPWRDLLRNHIRFNALVGLLLGITAFWQLSAGIRPGFNFHLLGATLFVLMFGWQIALITLTVVMCGTWIYRDMDMVALGLNGLLMLAIPVLFSEWLLRASQRYLPKNLFLFVLWNGFVCAAFAIALMIAATTLLLLAFTHYTWAEIQYHYFIPAPILIFAEAFATGAMITGFTVAQPEAVLNFSDRDYLDGK
ncbi:MAG TPA: energy-coupling factor ABC transporter permease [Gallionella sp.]